MRKPTQIRNCKLKCRWCRAQCACVFTLRRHVETYHGVELDVLRSRIRVACAAHLPNDAPILPPTWWRTLRAVETPNGVEYVNKDGLVRLVA